jgi:hypothetical protein
MKALLALSILSWRAAAVVVGSEQTLEDSVVVVVQAGC